MHVFLNHNSDVQPTLEAKIYSEQMDSPNTGMSYELDIVLFNFYLNKKSGISWTN